jgi:hypothetical protein
MLPGMSKTIVVGYDDKEPAKRALERAIAEAKESGGTLVVVTVVEFPLDPEGPQSFGALDDSPSRSSCRPSSSRCSPTRESPPSPCRPTFSGPPATRPR